MEIKSVKIANYRSIKEVIIPFKRIDDKACNILLGKNESGKSNILKALSLVDPNYKADYTIDCNKDSKKENESIFIIIEFTFNGQFWKKHISDKLNIDAVLIEITKIERYVEIDNNNTRHDYFRVFLKEHLNFSKYVYDEKNKILKIEDLYSGEEIVTEENIQALLPQYKILKKEKLEAIIEEVFFDSFEQNIPKIIYWESSSEYLINEPINLTQFKENYSISVPLKNIFHIADINDENIKHRIEHIIKDDEERGDLSQTLSEEITKYVNEVWPEHKINIKVSIESNLQCIVNVEDKDHNRPKYKMDQRSDGFKQFISILLNLSAENKASILKNRLILLDEPEVHLHPSGIKYLKDELLKISKNNSLVISTHSTYMIDKLNLHRHFSVRKDKSLTILNQIEDNNPYEEEVIYESLGTSLYEFISPIMLIFEGKTDKDLFDIFSNKFKAELNTKNISAISANGVHSIEKYVKFFNSGLVKGFVVVDSDKDGKNVKKQILQQNANYTDNNTFEINDLLLDNVSNKTLEDLLPKSIIIDVLKKTFNIDMELNDNSPYIEQIKDVNKTLNEKDLKMDIVKFVHDDINKKTMTTAKIQEKYKLYFEFISNLYTKIKS